MFADPTAYTTAAPGLLLFAASCLLHINCSKQEAKKTKTHLKLTAVNFHFTRKCNYNCGFCFHTAKDSHVESLENCKKIIKEARDHGCKKINFAGGEPFLPDYTSLTKTNKKTDLGEMVKYAKEVCRYESVSIISNGRHITEEWMEKYHPYVDVLGVSCDSADDTTNKLIGRGSGNHVSYVRRAAELCHRFKIPFKLNTVVNSYNWKEDMSSLVADTKPMRWKIFQVLKLEGENSGDQTKRDVTPFLISDQQFQSFVDKHQYAIADPSIMKIEDNSTMQSSYVLIDERGCFLDSSTGGKYATKSILGTGGFEAAWAELEASAGGGFDQQAFERRDGNFFSSSSDTATATTNGGVAGGCSGCFSAAANAPDGRIDDIEDLFKGQ